MAKTLDAAGVKRLIQEIKGANKNLNAPIPISTENTTESRAQNVKNIADYVEKAKAAGIDTTKSFRVTLEIEGYPLEGIYDIQYSYACGLQITDDGYAFLYNIDVTTGEVFTPCEIVTARSMQKVTSSMLATGARRPIILTPDTTEVDEGTYQKLLSDDVDVMFKDIYNTSEMALKEIDSDKNIRMSFNAVVCAENIIGEGVEVMIIVQYNVKIFSASPHSVVTKGPVSLEIEPKQYVIKSTLSPVLQEIDLRGTDAERKAKLDQFEADWKALTGAGDLTGARFVGFVDVESGLEVIFSYNASNGYWSGLNKFADGVTSVTISPLDGSLTITPLFSHLEAITIRTGNTPENKAANVAAIKAYVDNLKLLGVDVTKGYMIPAKLDSGNLDGFVSYHSDTADYPWSGVFIRPGGSGKFGGISKDGFIVLIDDILISGNIYTTLTTTSKGIIPAINEINTLAKGYSTIFTPIELTTETAQNKTTIDARVAAFTAQGISLTNGCCIPVTYKGVYAGNISLINGDWYGLLVKNTNNPADNINIKLSADGTITEGNSAQ